MARKLWWITLLAVLWALPARAGGLAGPVDLVPAGRFTVGVQGTYLSEMEASDERARITLDGEVALAYGFTQRDTRLVDIKLEDDFFALATVTWGATDWLNLFLKLGMVDGGRLVFNDRGFDWEVGLNTPFKADLENQFVWGLGARAKVWESPQGAGVVLGLEYLRYDDRGTNDWDAGGMLISDYWSLDDTLDFWRLDLTAVGYWRLGPVTPYAGVGYTYSQWDMSVKWTSLDPVVTGVERIDADFENQDKLSLLFGLNLRAGERLVLNLQGSFISSLSLSFGLGFTF